MQLFVPASKIPGPRAKGATEKCVPEPSAPARCAWVPHQTTQDWNLFPFEAKNFNLSKDSSTNEGQPKLERRYFQTIKPTEDKSSRNVKVFLQKKMHGPIEKWAKDRNRQLGEERGEIQLEYEKNIYQDN
jgi:hypothetical protein